MFATTVNYSISLRLQTENFGYMGGFLLLFLINYTLIIRVNAYNPILMNYRWDCATVRQRSTVSYIFHVSLILGFLEIVSDIE